MTDHEFHSLPPDLPPPIAEDGEVDHLPGLLVPCFRFASTHGGTVDLEAAAWAAGTLVLYIYPRTGTPGQPSPAGWDEFPGARGCTPQSCAFRDHHAELRALGATVMGFSSQSHDEQCAFADREGIPYPLLSDPGLTLAAALGLPAFRTDDDGLYFARLTMVIQDAHIAKVFYPVFPPDRNAADVLAWLRDRR